MTTATPGHVRAVLRNRDLRLLLMAALVSQTGDWILATGIAFEVYALTGSTLASAITLLATQAPQVIFGSVAGVLVDRWDARRVMIIVNLALSVVLLPLVAVRGAGDLPIIIAVVAISSCLTPFMVAADVSLLPQLVAAEHLVTANAVNAQVRNVSRLVGAALGGVIVSTGGLFWLALADIATFAIAAFAVLMIRHRSERGGGGRIRLVQEWVEGLGVIRGSRTLVVVTVFFGLSGIGEAAMGTLFAPFVSDVLGGDGNAFGIILAAQAVGGIVGGFIVTAVGHRIPARRLFAWSTVVFGLGDLALFLYPLVFSQVWPAVVIIALVGLPGAALFAGLMTLFQTHTDERVRGRVYGTLTTVQNLTMLASTYVVGLVSAQLGIVTVISVQGFIYVGIGVVAILALRPTATEDILQESAIDEVSEGTAVDDPSAGWFDNPATWTMLPTMSLPSNVRNQTVTDPLAMRALAHPTRLELFGLVAREGTLTAADAARQLGISHALASHHLRQLAKYGFVEPADSEDNRAHPWRVTATNTYFEGEEPAARAEAEAMDRIRAQGAMQQLAGWQARRAEAGEWADVKGSGVSGLIYLTRSEFAEFERAWAELFLPLVERRPVGHRSDWPEDAVPVSVSLLTVPLEPTEHGG